jgi:2-methylisocitrate lyase-like PEP mutase family enzyme
MLVLPNAWDAASARLVEAEGFRHRDDERGVAAALGYRTAASCRPTR